MGGVTGLALLAHLQHIGLMKWKVYKRPDMLVFSVAVRLSPERESHTHVCMLTLLQQAEICFRSLCDCFEFLFVSCDLTSVKLTL